MTVSSMTRRELLLRGGAGFGMVGLAGTLNEAGLLASDGVGSSPTLPHFAAKAKRVIFLFMNGAPSHVDTFDPKPALKRHAGQQPTEKLERQSRGHGLHALAVQVPRSW